MKGVYYPSLQSFANISKAHEQAIKTCENRIFRFECSGKTLHAVCSRITSPTYAVAAFGNGCGVGNKPRKNDASFW